MCTGAKEQKGFRSIRENDMNERAYWLTMMLKVAGPVLDHAENGTVHAALSKYVTEVERQPFMCLEIIGRTLSGIAPFLESSPENPEEERIRSSLAQKAAAAIRNLTDPSSPDYGFSGPEDKNWNMQWLVDAGFLALAVVRAPKALGSNLPPAVRKNLAEAFRKTRNYRPVFNNWLLFSAMVEAGLSALGEDYDLVRIDYALRQFEEWYAGDGLYGDGPRFRMDYYNSYTIQPMIRTLVRRFHDRYRENGLGETMEQLTLKRFQKYVGYQERSVAPDGSFPPIGRSLVYRCGAFHALAMASLEGVLPETVHPAMARTALTRVIHKTLDAPNTFTEDGWLTKGLAGCQPGLASHYVTTASLYMALLAFLPLGLKESDRFWTDPEEKSTWEKCFSGEDTAEEIPIPEDEDIRLYR